MTGPVELSACCTGWSLVVPTHELRAGGHDKLAQVRVHVAISHPLTAAGGVHAVHVAISHPLTAAGLRAQRHPTRGMLRSTSWALQLCTWGMQLCTRGAQATSAAATCQK
jgi:hypothetical protein